MGDASRQVRIGCAGKGRGRRAATLLALAAVAFFPVRQVAGQEPPAVDLSHPLNLEELVRIAKERNFGYARSVEDVQTAKGSYLSARSPLLPSAAASIQYNQTISKFTAPRVDLNTGEVLRTGVRDVTIQSRLEIGGRANLVNLPVWYGFQESKNQLAAAGYGLTRTGQNLRYNVTTQYFALVRAKELTRVSQEAYDLSNEQLARAQSLYDLGSVARSDVLQAQVNLASSDRDRISAMNSVDQERARLALDLALPVDSPVEVADPEPLPEQVPGEDEDALIRRALEGRPDLQQAVASLRAAELGVKSAEWERYPSLSGGYFYSKRAVTVDNVFSDLGQDISYGFSVALQWTLFDGLNTKGDIQRAIAGRRAQDRAVKETELQVSLEVRESLIGIKNAAESIRSAEEGVRFAEESVKLQKALYESGGGTLLEWNNAQVELTRAKVSLVEAQIDLHLALASLELALGGSI
jgi:outer membrane protein